MKLINLACLILMFSSLALSVETPQVVSNSGNQITAPVTKDNKMLLANQLLIAMDLDKSAKNMVDNTASIFSRVPKAQQPKNQPKLDKTYADAKVEYEKQKKKLNDDLINSIKLLLAQSFSESELSYLTQLSKYQPYVKFKKITSSEKFNSVFFEPNNKAIQILKEAGQKNSNLIGTTKK